MKTMNLKCIFNWLYGNGDDRAMTERQPREERGMKTSLYRPVSVSYVSRVSLVALLLLIGVSNGAWADQLSWGVASGEYKAGDARWGWTQKDHDWTFSLQTGVPNNVTFKRYCTKAATGESWSVSVSPDNSNWTVVWSNDDNASSWKTENVPLSNYKNTKYLKFHYHGTLEVKFSEITVYELIEFGDPSATTIAFGDVYVDSNPAAKTSNVSWTNLAASVSGVSSPVTINTTSFGSIGSYGTQTLSFDLVTSTAQSVNQTVTISNNRNSTKKTIKVTANIKKRDQALSWSEDVIENMLKGTTQNCAATANSGLAVSYTSSNSDILSVDANGKLTAKAVGGPVTITASQAGNYKYNAATSLTRTFYVKTKDTPIFTPNGFAAGKTCDLKVGDKVTLDVSYVSDGLVGDFKATATGTDILGFTRNGNTVTIEALNAGTSTATFTQTENGDIFGATQSYSFSVTKYQTSFSGSAYNLMVDGTQTADYSYTNTSAAQPTANPADDFYYTIDEVNFTNEALNKGINLVTFNPSNKQITACNAGTAKITLHQKETYKYTGATKSFNVAVYKYNSVFANVANLSVKVDENVSSAYTLTYTKPNVAYIGVANHTAGTPTLNSGDFYYTLTQDVQTSVTTGSPEPSLAITYNAGTKTAIGKNAGKGTVHLYQRETYKNNAADKDFDVIVSKHVPTFTWSNATLYYNSSIANFCASNQSATSVTRNSSNEEVATISGSTLTAYNKAESARITMTQAENYYWAEHTEYREVTPVKANNHVSFTIDQSLYNAMKGASSGDQAWDDGIKVGNSGAGGVGWDDKYIVIGPFTGIPNQLSCNYSCSDASTGRDWRMYESSDGTNWGDPILSSKDAGSFSHSLQPTTRYLKFFWTGNYAAYFKNVTITELQYFRTATNGLNFASNQYNHVPAIQSFVVEHANAGYQTAVTSPAHYQVSLDGTNFASSITYSTNATARTGGDKMGSFTVYVKYLANAEGTHAGNVVVSNNLRSSINVPVTGTTRGKLETHIEYIGETSYNVDIANTAATSLFRVVDENGAIVANPLITLSSNNASVIAIEGNIAIDPLCGGTTTITASYAGDDTYQAAADLSQSITIDRLPDEVSFNRGRTVLLAGDTYTTDWADALSETAVTYTSSNPSVLRVEDGQFVAVSKGTAVLTAISAGNCTYYSTSTTRTIRVRNSSDPCQTLLLDEPSTRKLGWYGSTYHYTIADGPIDKLSFKVWKYNWAATQEATLQILDAADNKLAEFTYSVGDLGSDEPNEPNREIDLKTNYPTAKKIRFYGEGTEYKYISAMTVTQQCYLTPSTTSLTMSTVKACEQATAEMTIAYSDLSRLTVAQTNADFTYEVWRGTTKLDDFDNDCGDYGSYTIKFFYTPQSKGDYTNQVTISASGKSAIINISGTALAPARTIEWNLPSGNEITATQSQTLSATAHTACQDPAGTVYFTASPADAVSISGNTVTFLRAATVTITAHTTSDADYEDAPTIDKVWTVHRLGTRMTTLPTITSTITYGDAQSVVTYANDWAAEDVLEGNAVAGTITYYSPAFFNEAGETVVVFNFNPTEIDIYDPCRFEVPVTVERLASSASVVASDIYYGNAVQTSLLTNGGPTAGTWTWNDARNESILPEGTYNDLQVHFTPANPNMTELDVMVSLTVLPLPVNTFTNAAGDNDWSNPANWQSGVVPAGVTPDIVVIGELQLDNEAVEVGSLTIENTGSVAVIASGSITVQETSLERSEYGSLTIGGNGELIANANIQVSNFHIETYLADKLIDETPVQAYSGQVTNLHNLTVNGDVRFTVHLDPSGEASEGWYAFAVPFEVDAQTGVYDRNGNRLTYGTHYAIATYNGSKRAQGKRGWEYERATLRQGVFYMITVADEQYSTLVFQKKVGASLTNGSTSIALNEYALNGGQTGDEGWNGLANNQLYHVNLKANATDKAQVYHHHTNSFEAIRLNDNSFVVASPFFIQAAGSGNTLMLETASHPVLYAPTRNGNHASEFCVRLGKDESSYSDQLFLSADAEASNQYEAGQDLQKAQGVAGEAKVAQMSVSGYGMQLCDAAFPLAEDGTAFFPLNLTSPKAQSLQLYVQQAVAGQTLYLTYEGTPVWNLSESAYTIDLNKGNNNAYGLLLRQNAPQSATGIDTSASEVKTDKLIRNGVLYMLRDGILYDAQGKRVQ